MKLKMPLSLLMLVATTPAAAQVMGTPDQLAATPLVRLNISENLRTPPDQASLTVGTEAKASTATAAVAADKEKTEKLLASIRANGIRERDIQTQGIQLSPDYRYDRQPDGSGKQVLAGYRAGNSVLIKTRDIPALTKLLDALTASGATSVYGPNFSIADPAPLRREARVRALQRGEAEAMEYARQQGFVRVRLLSAEEGVSYRGTDIIVTGSPIQSVSAPPPPPPPPVPERDGVVAPGQLETGVTLNLLYRMER